MIGIAVCDHDERMCSAIVAACDELVSNQTFEAHAVIPFAHASDLLETAQKFSFDIILCEASMPGLSGMDALRQLRDSGSKCHLILFSDSREYAFEAFSLRADNFLVKPFSHSQLSDALVPLIDQIVRSRRGYINLKATDGSLMRVEFSRIICAQTIGHNQELRLVDGRRIETRLSSKALFDKLNADSRFFKAGSSYLLNLDAITDVVRGEAHLVDGSSIAVPLRLRRSLQEAFLARSFKEGLPDA